MKKKKKQSSFIPSDAQKTGMRVFGKNARDSTVDKPRKINGMDGKEILTRSPFFRHGTKTKERVILYYFKLGAMGDYICWLVSIVFIAKNYDFIRGKLIIPHWFKSIAENVMGEYLEANGGKWEIFLDDIPEKYQDGFAIKQPTLNPINATMTHLVDLGFIYFIGMNPVPRDDRFYPKLDLSKTDIPKDFNPEKEYVVMTPGFTAPSRQMPANTFNELKEGIIDMGYTPVFLGKSAMNNGKRKIGFDEDYDYEGGIDLRDKTTTLEAALVMSKAKCVVGIDNGLLHLAAMTDVNIVFGYTIAGPTQRRPYRESGLIVEVYNEPSELPCTFCQEGVRFFMDHDFQNCLYKDYKCLKMLNSKTFIEAVKMAVNPPPIDDKI